MALIGEHTESEIRLWLETFWATLAAQVLGGTAGLQARRLFMTGQALGQAEDVAAAASTFHQAYIAGKIAGILGTNTARKMSFTQLVRAIENTPAGRITAADEAVLSFLDRSTAGTIARRAAVREAEVEGMLSVANTRWAGAIQSGMSVPEMAVARRSMLVELSEQMGFMLMGAGTDTQRFMQTELANYFQRGQVQEKNPEIEVWKMPRDTACPHCLRIYLNPDGSPLRMLLKDVIGNTNMGLPPEQWRFVIGATHPFCYCILFEEDTARRPGPNKTLADKREEALNRGQLIPTGPASQAARRGRSVLPPGTRQAVRIGDKVVPVGHPSGRYITARRGRRVSVARSGANSTEALYKTRTGAWTKTRQALHEDILRQLEENITVPGGKPIMQLTGGGSASGKGSLLKQGVIKPTRNQVFVDSDEIKALIPEYRALLASGDARAAAFVHTESSYLGDLALKRARAKGFNMTLDGTGDGSIEKLRGRILPQKQAGYKINADYVYISTDEAIRRSAIRAQQTGREVPEAMIRSTHAKISRVVPKALKEDLFDEFRLWDNSGKKVELIASKSAGKPLKVFKQKEWDDFLAKAAEGAEKGAVRAVKPTIKTPPAVKVLKPAAVKPASERYFMSVSKPAVARSELMTGNTQQAARAWNEIVEGKITPKRFFSESMKGTGATLEGFEFSGLSTVDIKTLEGLGVKLSEAERQIWFGYKATIKIEGSMAPANLTRVFKKTAAGWEVNHELLEIGWAAQGKGLAKKMLANDIRLYKQLGVKAINLEAGLEVGGYAWARYGFIPTQDAWRGVKAQIRKRMTVLETELTPASRAAVRTALASNDPKSIWKISDIREPVKKLDMNRVDPKRRYPPPGKGTEPLGSYLLRENNWIGSLSLGDDAAVARLLNYVGG